jgi:hypothetical protein
MEKLKGPFIEYKTRKIPYLKEKNHYKYITHSINTFEKFSTYALGI